MRTPLTPAAIAAVALAAAGVLAPAASAQTIDGSLDASYGPALFTQNTATGFGDNPNPDPLIANGSEIDGVYANVANGNLNVLVTGNVETNFNKLQLLIDSQAGGQTTLDASGTTGGGQLPILNGLTLDTGFTADYFVNFNGGFAVNDGVTDTQPSFFLDFVPIGGSGQFVGGSGAGTGTITGTGDFAGVIASIDNSNVAGVTGPPDTGTTTGAAAVTTGVEFQIPLSLLGNPTGPIGLAGFINGSDSTFLSNQVIGGLGAGAGNLGGPNTVNFQNVDGNQFVTVPNAAAVPEPASLGLLGAGVGLTLLRRRR